MKNSILILKCFLLTFLFIQTALACRDDFDCSIGSECVHDTTTDEIDPLVGVCVGGLEAGNAHDAYPSDALDDDGPNGDTLGKTCTASTECYPRSCRQTMPGVGGVCL